VSLFGETAKHELAHVKEQLDGLFDGQHLTLDGLPYCGKSRFAVQ